MLFQYGNIFRTVDFCQPASNVCSGTLFKQLQNIQALLIQLSPWRNGEETWFPGFEYLSSLIIALFHLREIV